MRALLNPIVVSELGLVIFRPGASLLAHFRRGRMLLENEPDRLADMPTGELPPADQPLAEEPELQDIFENEAVLRRAGGINGLESWLTDENGCQWPHETWHDENMTTMRHQPGAIRLCWHCDNKLRDHSTEQLAGIARANAATYIIATARRELGFDNYHSLTLPEFCFWLARNGLANTLPDDAARQVLRIPKEGVKHVYRESDLVPGMPTPREIVQEAAKQVLALRIDPETPESFMLRPKRHRWVNDKYTRWVKAQQCMCCNNPADDPHHLIGHGQGGMGTKAHDLFVIPLCRAHHNELHNGTVAAFEQKYGTQPELIIKLLDRALALGVLA
ncbi:YdfU protein [Enterobacter sp. FY-07]|uniref:DUF968 domain-containing protein n=1 Tax=Kosakonia oryzendophytica TaxID=1005665 RepID=UPI00077815F0|nr:DUF968 domain-containing protein [Kosakonia oryzendophytica]AMO48871.1 YdfU protein [Enterobacter sp. FY-07]WBT56623.1 DUF968 domain-containing protein [Kosakonia oryzendophytica]